MSPSEKLKKTHWIDVGLVLRADEPTRISSRVLSEGLADSKCGLGCLLPTPAEGGWWYEALDQSGIEDQFTFFYGLIEDLSRPVWNCTGLRYGPTSRTGGATGFSAIVSGRFSYEANSDWT
jgi:hypothetical protein